MGIIILGIGGHEAITVGVPELLGYAGKYRSFCRETNGRYKN